MRDRLALSPKSLMMVRNSEYFKFFHWTINVIVAEIESDKRLTISTTHSVVNRSGGSLGATLRVVGTFILPHPAVPTPFHSTAAGYSQLIAPSDIVLALFCRVILNFLTEGATKSSWRH